MAPGPAVPNSAFVLQSLGVEAAAQATETSGSTLATATELTRGPWNPEHQHAGPPIAMVCRSVQALAAQDGLTHVARLTANLLRPIPIGPLHIQTKPDYVGRNAGHYSAVAVAQGKEVMRATALVQREAALAPAPELALHLPKPPKVPGDCPVVYFPFNRAEVLGYSHLVQTRLAEGAFWQGPCAVWFRMRHPLVAGEQTPATQRLLVAADSGNGISAVLDYAKFLFVNSDLTLNLLRAPQGEWFALRARSLIGPDGGGLAESELFDEQGFIGRATQSLAVRART